MLYLVALHGSLALHFPYPHPRQGEGNEREWGLALSKFRSNNMLENSSLKSLQTLKAATPLK